MKNTWKDISVMTKENIQLFPPEYQDFFAQLEEKGVARLFPEKKRAKSAQNRKEYQEQLRQFVFEALKLKPEATVREILEITLPKLPREVAPAYLAELMQCAETLLREQAAIV